ncbi:ACT domain-containing protein [Wolffia australiana]
MGTDDAVVLQVADRPGERSVITVNCPDKTGLGCDLCRTILEFGLRITRGDVSTDGKWCYLVYWVVPWPDVGSVNWGHLKSRLLSVCPSSSLSFYFSSRVAAAPRVYLLKVLCSDRKGLLNDVTRVLGEIELIIQRVKVSTTPDGRVVDFFFITDGMEKLHTEERREETCARVRGVLGESCETCEIQSACPEYEIFKQSFCPLPEHVAKQLFYPEPQDGELLRRCNVSVDNSLSPGHTLLQIHCVDQKCLLYDIMRTLKDCGIQIAYGRFMSDSKGRREVDLFVQQGDGKKVVDPEKLSTLCTRLRTEIQHPLRVTVVNRGPDTELVVANPVELSGKGRPRVFYDITLALKNLGICVFSAEIGRQSAAQRQWEVYRILLSEPSDLPLSSARARARVVESVRWSLMGWS